MLNPYHPSYIFLNQYKIHILDLRKFLASLSNDNFEEIPLGDLLHAAKVFSRLQVSPLRKEIGLPENSEVE